MSDDLQTMSLSDSRKNMLYLLWGLYLGSLVTGGVTLIIGIALAYIKRDDAGTGVERSHYTSAIRVFWWSVLWCVVGMVLVWILIGWFVWAIATIWFIYRCVLGLVRAGESRAV
ncbi:hypothetical protein FXN63_01440 [Pigmentiphaga aceris]|uniref:Transmembrane protein n=1 Tax=Pigmentiphaga aceris TaxID=1940612 RepID=A0A5C0AWE5_9BURK|nr:hypothetical protein [Pigmentiphaga aceris]QEI04647.1 hypothetical protein FXN63_01440 [Pigmentiphaga aceris]